MAGPLASLLHHSPMLILDGAMGTELEWRGIDVSLPLWSARALTTHPDSVLQIHKEYIAAGGGHYHCKYLPDHQTRFCPCGAGRSFSDAHPAGGRTRAPGTHRKLGVRHSDRGFHGTS